MEILVELFFQAVGWLVQVLGELLLQIVGEAIAQLIGHSIAEPFRRPKPLRPWLAAIGYFIFGAIAGVVSLWLLPDLFIEARWLRLANLLVTPIMAGAIMGWVGSWRRRHEKEVIRLETFTYGFCFALSMALVRFVWGR